MTNLTTDTAAAIVGWLPLGEQGRIEEVILEGGIPRWWGFYGVPKQRAPVNVGLHDEDVHWKEG